MAASMMDIRSHVIRKTVMNLKLIIIKDVTADKYGDFPERYWCFSLTKFRIWAREVENMARGNSWQQFFC